MKPDQREQLRPPFGRIGESGWDAKLRSLLVSFDVPLPEKITLEELAETEQRLALTLPESLRVFLLEFGSVSFDYVEILLPRQMCKATNVPFNREPTENLEGILTVANAGGPDSQFLLDTQSGECSFARLNPARIERCLGSFDDLVRIACVDLYTGYYGWDDEELFEMRTDVMRELFGFVL